MNHAHMAQMLLFPDPRPLVEELGRDFFVRLPESPGVYLMRDQADAVLYVGKAKNLRQRLSSYRVANPSRLRKRHLRLLRAVRRIEVQTCSSEAAALAKEAGLLRSLRPPFNRAGTWPGQPRYLAHRFTGSQVELELCETAVEGSLGLCGYTGLLLRSALARLVWYCVHAEAGLAGLPAGWMRAQRDPRIVISCESIVADSRHLLLAGLTELFQGRPDSFVACVLERTATWSHLFEAAIRALDLETLVDLTARVKPIPAETSDARVAYSTPQG